MIWVLRVQNGAEVGRAEGGDAEGGDAEGGGESAFSLTLVARKRPWKTVALDGAGRACQRAVLLEDGAAVPATGVMAMAYETPEGKRHGRDEVVVCDATGQPLPLLAPTRERPQPIEPVAPEELLEYVATAIYAAVPLQLDSDLAEALRQGRIFRTRFRPRATTHERPAFLLAGRGGIFLLLVERLEFTSCIREIPLPPDDEDDIRDDEFWDDEESWMRMDDPMMAGARAQSHGDNGEMHNMDFDPWSTAPGAEE